MSELYGRLPIYNVGNAAYLAFTVGCALSTNTGMFLAFRFICGCVAASPMTIGGGTVADLYEPRERGRAMALFGFGPLLGLVSVSRLLPGCFQMANCVGYRSGHRRICHGEA